MLVDDEAMDEIIMYLTDEGLDGDQILEFVQVHSLATLTEEEAWDVIHSHIIRDDYDDDLE